MTATMAGWCAYSDARGDCLVDLDGAEKALVRGEDYIRATYPHAITDPLTERAKEAIYIAAKHELETPGFWSITATSGDAKVLTEVGSSIKWTPIAGGGVGSLAPRHSLIEALVGIARPLPGILVV